MTKCDIYVHTDVLNSRTGYNVTGYFQLAVIELQNNDQKCRLGWRRVEFLENGLSDDREILPAYRGYPVTQTCWR